MKTFQEVTATEVWIGRYIDEWLLLVELVPEQSVLLLLRRDWLGFHEPPLPQSEGSQRWGRHQWPQPSNCPTLLAQDECSIAEVECEPPPTHSLFCLSRLPDRELWEETEGR